MSPRSRFFRHPGRPYTEVAGRPVVIHPDRRTFYELTPAAATVWASLDGRSVRELATSAATPADEDPVPGCVELVRRWRALGLIEECDVLGTAPVDDLHRPPIPKPTISFLGDPAAAGAVLVVGPGTTSAHTVVVASPRLDGAEVGLRGLLQIDSGPTSDAAAVDDRLSPLELFGVLLQSVAEEELHDDGLADALASLAESLTARRLPTTDPRSPVVQQAAAELLR